MLLPLENPIKCHEEGLSLQLMVPPKRFDIFSPLTGGCSEGLYAFKFPLGHKVADTTIKASPDHLRTTRILSTPDGIFGYESQPVAVEYGLVG